MWCYVMCRLCAFRFWVARSCGTAMTCHIGWQWEWLVFSAQLIGGSASTSTGPKRAWHWCGHVCCDAGALRHNADMRNREEQIKGFLDCMDCERCQPRKIPWVLCVVNSDLRYTHSEMFKHIAPPRINATTKLLWLIWDLQPSSVLRRCCVRKSKTLLLLTKIVCNYFFKGEHSTTLLHGGPVTNFVLGSLLFIEIGKGACWKLLNSLTCCICHYYLFV